MTRGYLSPRKRGSDGPPEPPVRLTECRSLDTNLLWLTRPHEKAEPAGLK
jgi:hypothetical protein